MSNRGKKRKPAGIVPAIPAVPEDVSRGTSAALPSWRYRDPAEVAEKDELAAIKRTALRLIEDGKVEEARALAARAQIAMPKVKTRKAELRLAAEAVFATVTGPASDEEIERMEDEG